MDVGLGIFSTFIIGIALLAAFIGMALYDYRNLLWYQGKRERQAFHCIQCGCVFAVRSSKRLASCPNCGWGSQRLRF